MATERKGPSIQARNLVVVVQPVGSFPEQAGIRPRRLYGPVKGQVLALITDSNVMLSKQEPQDNQPPKYFVAQATQEELLQAAKDELEKNPNNSAVKKCLTSLVLIRPKAEKPFDEIDPETEIRMAGITDGQHPYPMHPTPSSSLSAGLNANS